MTARQAIEQNPKREEERDSDYFRRLMDLDGVDFKLNSLARRFYEIKGMVEQDPLPKNILTNKKLGELDWREACEKAEGMQDLYDKASFSQFFANIKIDTDKPIIILNLADTHIGAKGSDYKLLRQMTDEILETPNLYVALNGDLLEMAIRMRGVKEVTSQIMDPELQMKFLSSWLEEIKHKVLWTTWDNHSVMREEAFSGVSMYKHILGKEKNLIYSNGIINVDLTVGNETYKIVASHLFPGRSLLNPLHSQQRHMRFENIDREIALSGDTHKVGFAWYSDGGKERLAINAGTLHTNSGYAKRFFSLFTLPKFPVVELYPDEHLFVPYNSLGAWKKSKYNI